MTTVAFIAEFNPPHLGHAYFVEKIRKHFGDDACVVAIMSGNFVQRGTPAVLDAYTRAEMALNIGVDLVLELPFPYSSSTAERFATAGVSIAENLGNIEYLCFGSECGDLEDLTRIALLLNSKAYETDIFNARKDDPQTGFAILRERYILQALGEECMTLLRHPNNILAIEYLRAIDGLFSKLKPYTVKRLGDYHAKKMNASPMPSSSMIRELISEQNDEYTSVMGESNAEILRKCIDEGRYISDPEVLFKTISITLMREKRRSRGEGQLPPDCTYDLYERLVKEIQNVTSLAELLEKVRAKHETDSYIRRALLYLLMNIDQSAFISPPAYTRVLATNVRGRECLKEMRKTSRISILTKRAKYKKSTVFEMKSQSELAIFADQVYNLCVKEPCLPSDAVKKAPIIK